MIATLPIILGFQLLLAFLNYDISNEPKVPLQRRGWPPRGAGQLAPTRRRPE